MWLGLWCHVNLGTPNLGTPGHRNYLDLGTPGHHNYVDLGTRTYRPVAARTFIA